MKLVNKKNYIKYYIKRVRDKVSNILIVGVKLRYRIISALSTIIIVNGSMSHCVAAKDASPWCCVDSDPSTMQK